MIAAKLLTRVVEKRNIKVVVGDISLP